MSFTKRIDVLDIIIDILVDHEKTLDAQIARLEKLLDRLEEN